MCVCVTWLFPVHLLLPVWCCVGKSNEYPQHWRFYVLYSQDGNWRRERSITAPHDFYLTFSSFSSFFVFGGSNAARPHPPSKRWSMLVELFVCAKRDAPSGFAQHNITLCCLRHISIYYLAASYSFLGLEDRAAVLIFNAIKNCGVDICANSWSDGQLLTAPIIEMMLYNVVWEN